MLRISSALAGPRWAGKVPRPPGAGDRFVHTDVPRFVRDLCRWCWGNLRSEGRRRYLTTRFRVQDRLAGMIGRGIDRRFSKCDRVLVVKGRGPPALVPRVMPAGSVSFLRRGIDRDRFSPAHRDRRAWRGLSASRKAGRFCSSSGGSTAPKPDGAGEAARRLLDQGP